jgi:O-antigen/teichoic acid export membrane protein
MPSTTAEKPSRIEALLEHLRTPLFKNAYALIVNTGLTALLGAAYWVVAARIYDTNDVGRASALISAMMLISTVTQLNASSVLVRFLPRAGTNSARLIGRSYAAASGVAVVSATVVLIIAHTIGSSHSLLHLSLGLAIAFVLSTAVWSVFSLQDSALTGLRKSTVVPVENALYGVVKIVALAAFLPLFAASGIFASWTVPTALVLIPINWLIFRKYVPAHVAATEYNQQPLVPKQIAKFVAGDYAAGVFLQASTVLLPILVLSTLDATATAYFFIAQTIATSLDRMSFALSSSLTVEAAADEERFIEYTRSVFRRGLLLVGASAAIVIVFAPWILRIFSADYSEHATTVLRLLALASVPRVFSMVYGSVARMHHKTHHIAYITLVQAVILVGGSLILMPHIGITGVGVAAVASQAVIASCVLPLLLRAIRTPA